MKRTLCIAQIAFEEDIRKHISGIKEIIGTNRTADLIVFPELILHGHPSVERPEGVLYRRVKQFYRAIADDADDLYGFVKSVDARVIIGELKGGPGSFSNVATYIDRDVVVSAAKTHVHWTENFRAGRELRVIDTPVGKIGMIVCFDGAFPEVWRVLALQGAEIVVNISATPKSFPDKYIWRRLQGAAIGNQVFVVYANRPGAYFSGHSAVIDPTGEVLADAGEHEHIMHCEIDLAALHRWRQEEQVYAYRRPLLYRPIVRRSAR